MVFGIERTSQSFYFISRIFLRFFLQDSKCEKLELLLIDSESHLIFYIN